MGDPISAGHGGERCRSHGQHRVRDQVQPGQKPYQGSRPDRKAKAFAQGPQHQRPRTGRHHQAPGRRRMDRRGANQIQGTNGTRMEMAVMRPLPYQDKWSIWPKAGAGDRLPCQLSQVWRDNSKDGSLEERSYRYTKKNIFCPYVPDFLHPPPFPHPLLEPQDGGTEGLEGCWPGSNGGSPRIANSALARRARLKIQAGCRPHRHTLPDPNDADALWSAKIPCRPFPRRMVSNEGRRHSSGKINRTAWRNLKKPTSELLTWMM